MEFGLSAVTAVHYYRYQ